MRRKLGVTIAVLILATTVHASDNQTEGQSKEDPSKKDQSKDGKSNEHKYTITGKVVNHNGEPVAHAVVAITGPKGPITQTTDTTGSYSFQGQAGKYTVTAKANGKSGQLIEEVTGSKELKKLKLE